MAREIRVTFTDKEEDLYNYIVSKSSKTAFLKDLASVEKKREENYINSSLENHLDEIANKLINKIGVIETSNDNDKDNENKTPNVEYDFDIEDLDL
ncbi:hypothetical protein [Romboutsia sp. Marseille-P6047]|uniref:hypothetical protein n=1 Tax=Romboutsia sp. Marseille-P6047 TaxID=2161817 RepID=UPI000F059499|nr:hypothetical protein [Romboutsia sp. Marseille-P6047]